jgi:hypothetical protein
MSFLSHGRSAIKKIQGLSGNCLPGSKPQLPRELPQRAHGFKSSCHAERTSCHYALLHENEIFSKKILQLSDVAFDGDHSLDKKFCQRYTYYCQPKSKNG